MDMKQTLPFAHLLNIKSKIQKLSFMIFETLRYFKDIKNCQSLEMFWEEFLSRKWYSKSYLLFSERLCGSSCWKKMVFNKTTQRALYVFPDNRRPCNL